MQRRTYSDSEVAAALAALELNAGNVSRTAEQTGIPRPTLILWRDRAIAATDTDTDTPDIQSRLMHPPQSHHFAGLWAQVVEAATARLLVLLPTETDLRAVATAAGIASDKHLDYSAGRRGMTNNLTQNNTNNTQINIRVVYDD